MIANAKLCIFILLTVLWNSTCAQQPGSTATGEGKPIALDDGSGYDVASRRLLDRSTSCAVTMPSQPKLVSGKVETPHGQLDVRSHVLDRGKIAFSLTYTEYPETFLQALSLDPTNDPWKLLEMACDGSLKGRPGSQLRFRKKTELDGHPGMAQALIYPEGKSKSGAHPAGVSFQRCFLKNRALYTVMVDVDKQTYQSASDAHKEKMIAFLDSFAFEKDTQSSGSEPAAPEGQ